MIARCYGRKKISERHRYVFANAYREALEQAGSRLSVLSPDGRREAALFVPSSGTGTPEEKSLVHVSVVSPPIPSAAPSSAIPA